MSILSNSCHPYFSIALCPCNLCTLQYKLVAENSPQNKYFCPAWVQKWWKVILRTEEMCMRIQIVPSCTFLNMQHEVSLFWASSKMYQPAKKTVMFKLLSKKINLRELRFTHLTWIFPPSFWPPGVDVSWSTVDNPGHYRSCPQLLSVQQYWHVLLWMLHEENQQVDHTSKDWTIERRSHTCNLINVQFC